MRVSEEERGRESFFQMCSTLKREAEEEPRNSQGNERTPEKGRAKARDTGK